MPRTSVDDVLHHEDVLSLQGGKVAAGDLHASCRADTLVRLDLDEVECERDVRLKSSGNEVCSDGRAGGLC